MMAIKIFPWEGVSKGDVASIAMNLFFKGEEVSLTQDLAEATVVVAQEGTISLDLEELKGHRVVLICLNYRSLFKMRRERQLKKASRRIFLGYHHTSLLRTEKFILRRP